MKTREAGVETKSVESTSGLAGKAEATLEAEGSLPALGPQALTADLARAETEVRQVEAELQHLRIARGQEPLVDHLGRQVSRAMEEQVKQAAITREFSLRLEEAFALTETLREQIQEAERGARAAQAQMMQRLHEKDAELIQLRQAHATAFRMAQTAPLLRERVDALNARADHDAAALEHARAEAHRLQQDLSILRAGAENGGSLSVTMDEIERLRLIERSATWRMINPMRLALGRLFRLVRRALGG